MRVGKGEDDAIRRHTGHRGLRDLTGRNSDENVSSGHRHLDRPRDATRICPCGQIGLDSGEPIAFRAQQTLRVGHAQVLDPTGQQHVGDRDTGRAGPGHDHFQVLELPAREPRSTLQGGNHHDRGAVLIVVEHRDVEALLQPILDLEAARRRDVLQVDPPESGGDLHDRVDDVLGVGGVQTDRHSIDAAEFLEEQRLALHHRQGCLRTDVAEAQHRRAVGHDQHRVGLPGVVEHQIPLGGDRLRHPRHPRGVGQGETCSVTDAHSRAHLDLPSPVQRECRVVL